MTNSSKSNRVSWGESGTKSINKLKLQLETKVSESSEIGTEIKVTRKVRNPNLCHALTLNYYEAGQPTALGGGLPPVMLPGGGPGASAWSNFGSALPGCAEDFRPCLVDKTGSGQRANPAAVGT